MTPSASPSREHVTDAKMIGHMSEASSVVFTMDEEANKSDTSLLQDLIEEKSKSTDGNTHTSLSLFVF